jgi:parvulin-like peptidyl-prolyl isomerase
MKKESLTLIPATVLVATLILTFPGPVVAEQDGVFARVDDVVITRDEFERAVYSAARQTYYHGRPPAGDEFLQFRRDVADRLIDRQLLLTEARRRGLQPDEARIDARIAGYEARYGDTQRWQTEGPKMVALLRARFEEDSLMDALEADVRAVAAPDETALRAYYEANPGLFTEPARNRVALILLGVPPSASAAVWQEAREAAAHVRERIDDGASFDELARRHSSDRTAPDGGDMGYLHEGMLSANAERTIAELAIGEVSEPVQVLEGMAIFRLTEQRPPSLHAFDDVRERAEELWLRDKGEQEWNKLVAELRSASDVSVDTNYLASLPGSRE